MRRVILSTTMLMILIGCSVGCGGKEANFTPEPKKSAEEQKKYDDMMANPGKTK